MEFIALVLVCCILAYVAIKVNFSFLRWVSAISWFGMFIYWMQHPPAAVVPGEATHVAIMCVFICAGLGMALYGMGREIQKSKKETIANADGSPGKEKTSIFSKFKFGLKAPDEDTKRSKLPWARRQSEEDYRDRVHRAAFQYRKDK